jgi:hypothetical protein
LACLTLALLIHIRHPAQQWFTIQKMGQSLSRRSGHAMVSNGTWLFVLGGLLEAGTVADDSWSHQVVWLMVCWYALIVVRPHRGIYSSRYTLVLSDTPFACPAINVAFFFFRLLLFSMTDLNCTSPITLDPPPMKAGYRLSFVAVREANVVKKMVVGVEAA